MLQFIQTVLGIISTVRSLLPAIIALANDIEAAIPQSASTIDLVKQTLQSAWAAVGNAEVSFETIWPALETLINSHLTTASPAAPANANAVSANSLTMDSLKATLANAIAPGSVTLNPAAPAPALTATATATVTNAAPAPASPAPVANG